MLKLAEEPANSFKLLGHAKLKELAALLQYLHLLEVSREVSQDPEAIRLGLQEFEQVD